MLRFVNHNLFLTIINLMNMSNPKWVIKFYIDQYESSYLLRSLIRSSGHCCNYFIVIYCRILWCWDIYPKYFCDQNVCVTEGRLRVASMVCIMKGQMSGNNVGEDDLLRNYRVVLLSSACYKRIPELLTLACGIETSSGSK